MWVYHLDWQGGRCDAAFIAYVHRYGVSVISGGFAWKTNAPWHPLVVAGMSAVYQLYRLRKLPAFTDNHVVRLGFIGGS